MSKLVERGGLRNVKLIAENQRSVTNEDGTITVHIPISFKRHGGRKYIIAPEGIPEQYAIPKAKESLLKAIGRAFAWQTMLDSDTALTQDDIAEIAKLPRSYVSRVMRATLLAPDIIEAILDGRQPKHMTLTDLTRMPNDWNEQREYFGCI
jgi:hypothetical protein